MTVLTACDRLVSFLRRGKHWIDYQYFLINGYKPWSRGYEQYRWKHIEKSLAMGNFPDKVGGKRFGYRIDERIVEYPWFFERLPDLPGLLFDAGSVLNHAILLDHPKLTTKKLFISTLSPEKTAFWHKGISYIYEDIRKTHLRPGIFDWVVCLSTLEHVGMDNTYLYTNEADKNEFTPETAFQFLGVLRALLKDSGTLYLSVPYGKYANHGWFRVSNAEMLDGLKSHFKPSKYIETIYQYADDRWQPSSREKAKDATCFDIHAQKKNDPDYAAFSRAVACMELTK
ncbi:MAG: hypothetical protein LBD67_04150 [Candidatus Accumulibacter sp.]|nr:hypothetical protein [Accumulibacter sp.]